MGKRFDERYKVRKGDELTPDFFDTRFRDLDDRLGPIEGLTISWEEALRIVKDRVLERSESVIADLRDQLVGLTQLQWLTGESGSSVHLVQGQDAQFLISEASRGLFASGPYAVVSRTGDPTAYAIVRNVAYDRAFGQWATHVEATFGDLSAAHADWSIAAVAGSTLAQIALLAQGNVARDAAAASATAAAGSATSTAGDRVATGQDRAATAADRVASAASAQTATDKAAVATTKAQEAAASAASIAGGPVTSVDGQTGVVTLAKLTARGDANYAIVGTPANARDKVVALTAALTAPRTWTLPAANAVPAGYGLRVLDVIGGISAVNTLTVQRAGTDTVNGATSYTIRHPNSDLNLISDGVSKWAYDVQGVGRGGTGATNEKDARLKLGIEGRATLGDAAATIPAVAVVALTSALTAPRTWTLPAASTLNPGQGILVGDEVGGISAVNTLTLAPAGADTINGTATLVLKTARSLAYVVSNGVDRWSFDLGAASADAVAALSTTVGQNTAAINALKASPAPTLDDVRTLAIQLAKLKGSTVGMAGGVADDFRDQAGVDTANSVNAFFDAGSNTLGNSGVASTDDLAPMTGPSAPAGQTASASSELNSGYAAWLAYDGSVNSGWAANGSTGSIQRTSAAARIEVAYAITIPNNGPSAPITWTRWGSNDGGATKTTLDTQSNVTNWAASERKVFVIPTANRAAFKTYGLTVTADNGATYLQIQSLESMVALSGAMDLRSVAFAAQAVPTKGSIFVLVKATADTITANTNLLAKLSRDGGTTHTTASLVSTGSFGGYTVYEANGFDLTGQPSGSSMKWRLQTVGTALAVQVDAVVAQWG